MKINQTIFFRDILCLVLLAILTLFAWREMPNLVLKGDDFDYFILKNQAAYWRNFPLTLLSYWSTGLILGTIMPIFFKLNFSLYFYFEIIMATSISFTFFILVYTIFKNRLSAFIASIIFAVNYFGQWGVYVDGVYPYFLERFLNLIFLIPSFLFLHNFLETEKKRDYVTSMVLFILGVGLAHWNVVLTMPYLIYPLFKNKSKFLYGLPYLLISGFFIYIQELIVTGVANTGYSLTDFIFHPEIYNYPQNIIRQLVYWSEYSAIFKSFILSLSQNSINPLIYINDIKYAIYITPYMIGIYIIAGITIYKTLPKLRPIFWVSIFTTLSILFLNSYFGVYKVDIQPGANRYLYMPTFSLAIFWGLFAHSLFQLKKSYTTIFVFMVIGAYYFLNVWIINQNFVLAFQKQIPQKKVWEAVKSLKDTQGLIILPTNAVGEYEKNMMNDHLYKNGQEFILDRDPIVKNLSITKIVYDPKCLCTSVKK
ncbi:MAG: hypothetical protein Q7R43_02930 [Candidatus Daviesbacteria bacterium]|nr:hypothetical protein [Candidatus Daviesbacteria bacterium]